jgi:uncharacterized membrane protein
MKVFLTLAQVLIFSLAVAGTFYLPLIGILVGPILLVESGLVKDNTKMDSLDNISLVLTVVFLDIGAWHLCLYIASLIKELEELEELKGKDK